MKEKEKKARMMQYFVNWVKKQGRDFEVTKKKVKTIIGREFQK